MLHQPLGQGSAEERAQPQAKPADSATSLWNLPAALMLAVCLVPAVVAILRKLQWRRSSGFELVSGQEDAQMGNRDDAGHIYKRKACDQCGQPPSHSNAPTSGDGVRGCDVTKEQQQLQEMNLGDPASRTFPQAVFGDTLLPAANREDPRPAASSRPVYESVYDLSLGFGTEEAERWRL